MCIFILLFQTPLCRVVKPDIPPQLLGIALQHLIDVLGQHQTGVAFQVAILGHCHVGHTFQTLYQTIVAGDISLCLLQEICKGQPLPVEIVELLGRLMACIGQVEHIVLLL